MTDEDRRETIADIRQASHDVDMVKSMLETAADQIEHLGALLAIYRRAFGYVDRAREEKGELPQ